MRLFGDEKWVDHEREAKEVWVQAVDAAALNTAAPNQITWIGHSRHFYSVSRPGKFSQIQFF